MHPYSDDVASEDYSLPAPTPTDGARRRTASISSQNPYRISQRYGSGFVYGGGYGIGYGGVFGYGREAPLTPEQVLELAKASLKPDLKTLGVRGHGQGSVRSGSTASLSESGEEEGEGEEGEVKPANFLPMGEGEFLPFVDRPKEVRLTFLPESFMFVFSLSIIPKTDITLSRSPNSSPPNQPTA